MEQGIPEPPYVPPKNPFQTFLLLLSLTASIPLIGGYAGSAALDSVLTDTATVLWGLALMLGSSLALFGTWLPHRRRVGMLLERTGLILTGGAALIYVGAMLKDTVEVEEIRYTASIHLAYGIACWWRVFQISKSLRWISKVSISPPDGGTR